MKIQTAVIAEQHAIAKDIYRISLECDIANEARAGQFVNVYPDDGAHLLPRPISICDIHSEAGRIDLVYRVVGEGTAIFARKSKGDSLRILGPLGNGYDVDSFVGREVVVVGGGLGIPPMLGLLHALKDKGIAHRAVLGYRDEEFLLDDFKAAGAKISIASDTGFMGIKGTVIDALEGMDISKGTVICSCGPLPMLRALKAYSSDREAELYVSLEERMACGVGACLGCVTATVNQDEHSKVNNTRVCKDGPVFFAEEVVL